MSRIEVHKLGGTSVGSAERIRVAARLLVDASDNAHIIAVASAMGGVTDVLVAAARQAAEGADPDAALEALRTRHAEALVELGGSDEVAAEHAALLGELADLLRAVAHLGELTLRIRDRVWVTGEKLSVRLLALAIRGLGGQARAVDADTFLETDGTFGSASPLSGVADRTTRAALMPLVEQGIIPVVTGFCGRAPDGGTTTLGRGGSDLTATVLAASLGADEVTIWTDVDGVFTADPRAVPDARSIPQLNYREAAELSFYGAKVLHQRTMIPVIDAGIPVLTRNSFAADLPGTRIDGRFTPGSHPVKGISAIRKQALVSLEGKGMAGVPGVAARLFGVLAEHDISVTMISQSSSESSICLAVPAEQAALAEASMKRAFRQDLSAGLVEEVLTRPAVGLIAAVGLGMAHTPGIAGRCFSALGRARVNVLAIAQGSSELNISLAVDEADVSRAVRVLHHEFGLHQQDTGVDSASGFDVALLGTGQVGRALARLLRERRDAIEARFGLTANVVALADSSGFVLEPQGLEDARLDTLLALKEQGGRLAEHGVATEAPTQLVEELQRWRLVRPVLVDLTASERTRPALLEALRRGMDVVTANKVPLAGPLPTYRELLDTAEGSGTLLKAEATVGAGLPIVDTLEMLLATGDQLHSAAGCLSGTLGFVMTRLEQGAPLSEVVREAHAAGYTEPDPVDDLSGEDVARKATILARWSGLSAEATVQLEGLVDPALRGLPLDELVRRLQPLDAPMAARIAALAERGEVLRYVATVDADGIRVGPQAVPADSPLGRLQGTDNSLVLRSVRYHDRPLVITGPGAGVEVTAMGVLGDLLRIAAERR